MMLRMDQLACSGVLAALFIGACGGTPPGAPVDAEPTGGDTGSIGIGFDSGLGIGFFIEPELPVEWDRDEWLKVERVEVDLRNLRLIGDAAAGDERTRMESFKLRWPSEEEDAPVQQAIFENAPPGLYSHVRATAREFKVHGKLRFEDGGTEYKLEINTESADPPVEVSLTGVDLGASAPLAIEIELDLDFVLADIDYSMLEIEEDVEEGGEIEYEISLEPGDPQFDVLVEKLSTAFSQR